MKKFNVDKMNKYILIFIITAFIGWAWEVIWEFLKHGNLINSGTMHGPWLPIYGSGSIIIYLLLNEYKDKKWLIFIGSFVICTISEYLTSMYLEYVYGMSWWNYTDKPFNINGRICLPYSIIFGLSGLLVTYRIIPFIKKLQIKINKKALTTICIILLSIFIFDFIFSTFYPNVVNPIKVIDTEKFK